MAGSSLTAFTSKRFPENVGTDDVPNYIIFTPQEVDFGNIDNYGNNFSRNIREVISNTATDALQRGVGNIFAPLQNVVNGIGGIVDSIANGANSFLSRLTAGTGINFNLNYPSFSNLANGAIGRVISGTVNIGSLEIQLGMRQQRNVLRSMGSISIFMPKELSSNLNVEYKTEELGATGVAAADFIRERGYSSAAGISEALTGGVSAVISDLTRSQFKAPFALATGRVANQFTYAIFNGVKHREFKYTFNMVAKNEQESRDIKDICDLFMYHMLPEKSNSTDFHFYEIPNQWTIEYQRLGSPLQHYESPRECFLKDINIAYGSDTGMMTHTDGSPLNVKLTLTFTEIQPLNRGGGSRTITNRSAGISSVTGPTYDEAGIQ